MTGITNYTAIDNNAEFGFDQINAGFAHFDALIGETVGTANMLPSSGNWTGRTIMVGDTGFVFRWYLGGWRRNVAGLEGRYVQAGTTAITTNANGDASIPLAFPAQFTGATITDAHTSMSNGPIFIRVNVEGSTNTSLAFRLWQSNGSILPAFTTRVSWIAWGI